MKHIQELIQNRKVEETPKKRASERGDFLKYFAKRTDRPIKYIAFRLTGIPTADFYYIQKQCDSYKGPWAKAFFGMLKPKKK